MAESEKEKLFLPVPDLKLSDLLDWRDPDQRHHRHLVHMAPDSHSVQVSMQSTSHRHKKCFGNMVELNDNSIALFRIGREIYATQSKCPHAGGPLHLADIEELIPGQVCLKCPWHKWKFDIDTGHTLYPYDRDVQVKIFPVRVDEDERISIGFDSLGPSAFRTSF